MMPDSTAISSTEPKNSAHFVGLRFWDLAPSVVAACWTAVMRADSEALLVNRVWRVTTSSLASKIALMSRATLISCNV